MTPDRLGHLPCGVEVDRAPNRQKDMQACLARRFHDGLEPHVVEDLPYAKRDFLTLLEGHLVELRLVARRFLARIDVRVDIENYAIRIIHHRLFECPQRALVIGSAARSVTVDFGSRVPDMEFECSRLREPKERRQVVAYQVIM